MLPSSKQELRQMTQKFKDNERAVNILEGDKVQTKKFIKFIIAYLNLDPDDELNVTWMRKRNKIHEDYLVDVYLQDFITHEYKYHADKGNQLEPNLRSTKGYIVRCMTWHGRKVDEFPEFRKCWDGMNLDEDFILSKNHEKAPSASLQQHIKIKQVNVHDENGMFDKETIQLRDAYGMDHGTILRRENVHKLKEKNVIKKQQSESNLPIDHLFSPKQIKLKQIKQRKDDLFFVSVHQVNYTV